MFRTTMVLAALVLMAPASGAYAADSATSFDRLRSAQWSQAYSAVRHLEGLGLSTGSPRGSFDGKRALTRYEFASATERMFRSLQANGLSIPNPVEARRALADLNYLLDQFSGELSQLGLDPADLQTQIRGLRERLDRMERPGSSSASPSAMLNNRNGFGFRNAWTRLSDPDPFGLVDHSSLPESLRSPVGLMDHPGLSAPVGLAQIGFDLERPNSLDTAGKVPFENPADALSYRAQLSLPFGSYSLSAFYGRDNGRNDRYGAYSPFFRNQITENLGGALSGRLTNRMAFRLETARARPLDDALTSMVYFRGGLKYALGSGFSVDLGFERNRLFNGPGEFQDETAYTMKLGHDVGRNVRLDLLLRLSGMSGSNASPVAGRDYGDSSAVTQLTVKF